MSIPFDEILAWVRTWALPPLLGAAIGYATNFVAIRMLFRPLVQKRLLGIPIPLTPGVIPRQRRQLARSIGRVVSRELLTPDAIRSQLKRPEFLERLRVQIEGLTGKLLAMPVRTLAGAVQSAPAQLERGLSSLLYRLVRSHGFIYALRALIGRALEAAGSRTLGEVAEDLTLATFVQQRLVPRLADAEVGRRVGRAIRDVADRPNTTLGDLLAPAAAERLAAMLPELMPSLMRELVGWLSRPAMRGELETRGRLLLASVLDQLNIVQKLFVGAAQYNRTLYERMPEIVEETLRQLELTADDPKVVAHMQEALSESLASARSRPLSDLLPESTESRVSELWGTLAGGFLSRLLDTSVQRFLEEHGQTPVAELAARYLGVSVSETVDAVSDRLLRYLSDERTARLVAAQIAAAVDGLADSGEVTVAELLAIGDDTKAALDGVVAARAERLIGEQVPPLVAALDVERLVIDRIDALEVHDVERILLGVIARHLKWINMLGALLGSLIGLTQLVLRGSGAAMGGF